jgi:hypothetical protein
MSEEIDTEIEETIKEPETEETSTVDSSVEEESKIEEDTEGEESGDNTETEDEDIEGEDTEDEDTEGESSEDEESDDELDDKFIDNIENVASKLNDELDKKESEETKYIKEDESDIIKRQLNEYVMDFRKQNPVHQDILKKFKVRLARIVIAIHGSSNPKVFEAYFNYLMDARDTLTDIIKPMEQDIKNGLRERNSVMVMHEAFKIVARAKRKGKQASLSTDIIRKNVINKVAANYIFNINS